MNKLSKVIKRDNTVVDFDKSKIETAIKKARDSANSKTSDTVCKLYTTVIVERLEEICTSYPTVELIQDTVEDTLIKYNDSKIAKEYIAYRRKRDEARSESFSIMNTISDIISKDSKDMNLKRENANIDANTAMGTMLKIGSEVSKEFYCRNMLKPHIAEAHIDGDIHIHDLDFYSLTETCCQIDIGKLLHNGFSTGHGYLREPSNIISASALACIVIQANQNDQHGGQAIPNFDYGLAPYVAKSYIKNIIEVLEIAYDLPDDKLLTIKEELSKLYDYNSTIINLDDKVEEIINKVTMDA